MVTITKTIITALTVSCFVGHTTLDTSCLTCRINRAGDVFMLCVLELLGLLSTRLMYYISIDKYCAS